jgi:hypothetical protein
MEWPKIGLSPINKYHVDGLFDMDFPTLFPIGNVNWLQPCLVTIHIHEYTLHLLKYHDQIFDKNTKFHYFILNMIMKMLYSYFPPDHLIYII